MLYYWYRYEYIMFLSSSFSNTFLKEIIVYYIKEYKSKDGPRFRIMSKNGKIIASSEAYATKSSRTRTINNLLKNHNFHIKND